MTMSWGVTGAARRDPWGGASDGDGVPPPPTAKTPNARGGGVLPAPTARAPNARGGGPDAARTDARSSAVLYDREAGDVDAIDANDVAQGAFGDCYLMASLAALASTPGGRAAIRSAITENRGAGGQTESYTVRLQDPHYDPKSEKTTFTEVRITVDASFVEGQATPRDDGPVREIWPLVIEKAYAQLLGGYASLARGGVVARALAALTGRPVFGVWLAGSARGRLFGYSARDLQRDLALGRFVVVQTLERLPDPRGSAPGGYGLYPQHAYAVSGTVEIGGETYVKLRNPWNRDHPAPIPFRELHRWMFGAYVGSAATAP